MKRSLSVTFVATFILALFCVTTHAKKPGKPGGISFDAVELPPPDGLSSYVQVIPRDVNEQNQAVGQIEVDPRIPVLYHAVYWSITSNGATAIDLGGSAVANGLNEFDQIVGGRVDANTGNALPVLWPSPFSAPIELPLPAGHHTGWAQQINDDGLIVGQTRESVPDVDGDGNPIVRQLSHAVAWQVYGDESQLQISAPALLGGLSSGKDNWSYDVNESNEVMAGVFASTVVGTATNANGNYRAVTWELLSSVGEAGEVQIVSAGPTEVGVLPGDTFSYGNAINRFGDVTGRPGYRKLFGQPVEELLPPANISNPAFVLIGDINDAAEVVGEYWYGGGLSTPLMWLADGTPVELNKSLGGTGWANFHSPISINNDRTIVGYGRKYEGKGKNRTTVDAAFVLFPQ